VALGLVVNGNDCAANAAPNRAPESGKRQEPEKAQRRRNFGAEFVGRRWE